MGSSFHDLSRDHLVFSYFDFSMLNQLQCTRSKLWIVIGWMYEKVVGHKAGKT